MERPLPTLRRNVEISRKELLAILTEGRARVQAELQRRAGDKRLATDGNLRERVLRGVAGHYEKMAVDLDAWMRDAAARTARGIWTRAGRDTGTATATAKFSRERALRYIRLVSPENASALAVTQGRTAAGARAMAMAREDVTAIRKALVSVTRLAAVTGMTARQQQREIEARVLFVAADPPSWRFIDKAGRQWQPGNYFNMLTRTTLRTVAHEAYVDRMTEDGFDLATIEGGGDPCPVCATWRGVVVSVTGGDKDFPSLDDAREAGVFHPNCVCEPRYIDEEDPAVEKQRGRDNPEEPDADAWRDYAHDVRRAGEAREYSPATEESAAEETEDEA